MREKQRTSKPILNEDTKQECKAQMKNKTTKGSKNATKTTNPNEG